MEPINDGLHGKRGVLYRARRLNLKQDILLTRDELPTFQVNPHNPRAADNERGQPHGCEEEGEGEGGKDGTKHEDRRHQKY